MNYWHMQLDPNEQNKFEPDKIREIVGKKQVIGLWEDHRLDAEPFKEKMKIGDIVAVRDGKNPVALVKVVSDWWEEEKITGNLDWFKLRRKIEVLDYYKSEYKFIIPKVMGTLTICADHTKDTSKVIIKWYKQITEEKRKES